MAQEKKITRVFVDGSAGTTGLRIIERLQQRADIELVLLPDETRKDPAARKEALKSADIAFLCLPDDAARESVSLLDETDETVIIDTSTAHRILPGWAYGFPELSSAHRSMVQKSRRIAVPGCHAGGFISLIFPLVSSGLLSAETPLSCFSLTGYSGGGKKMIADYEADPFDPGHLAPRPYAAGQTHKHLPEMTMRSGISAPPVFFPTVGPFYSGMEVMVPLFANQLSFPKTKEQIYDFFAKHYAIAPLVEVAMTEKYFPDGIIPADYMAGKDSMLILIGGNDERITLTALFDNLGKGASGTALSCMNLAMGLPVQTGLVF